jgi:hypothetical protein
VASHLAREVAEANTARHVLEILGDSPRAERLVAETCHRAREQAAAFAGSGPEIAFYVFDFDGELVYRSG